jgi:hypothetical protein
MTVAGGISWGKEKSTAYLYLFLSTPFVDSALE